MIYLHVSFLRYADLSSMQRISVNRMFCSCILSVKCSAESIVVSFCAISMFMSVFVVEDSESVLLLLVEVDVDVVGDACSDRFLEFLGILNACSLILVCVWFFW